jgi:exopolysaccharide/PEP-CTERM locus tyrosine autokinase
MKSEKPSRGMTSLIERASSHYGLSAASEPRARKRLDVPLIPDPVVEMVEAVSVASVEPVQPEVQPQAVPDLEPVNAAPVKALPLPAQPAGVADINLQRLADLGFIVPGHPPTALSEEFRIVKRPLLLNAFGGRSTPSVDRGRAILVCSAHPNEGKTFCSINLAMSLVNERNVEVVLVDADVAKPEILSSLGVTGAAGLLDAIVQDVDPETLIIPTTIPGLSVLPAGHQTPNDTELLSSAETFALVEALLAKNPARIVIFDCAPALAASPASALAHHIGQILLVVRADRTSENDLSEAVKLLAGQAPIQLLLNGMTFPGSSQKYGSYYGYGG